MQAFVTRANNTLRWPAVLTPGGSAPNGWPASVCVSPWLILLKTTWYPHTIKPDKPSLLIITWQSTRLIIWSQCCVSCPKQAAKTTPKTSSIDISAPRNVDAVHRQYLRYEFKTCACCVQNMLSRILLAFIFSNRLDIGIYMYILAFDQQFVNFMNYRTLNSLVRFSMYSDHFIGLRKLVLSHDSHKANWLVESQRSGIQTLGCGNYQ